MSSSRWQHCTPYHGTVHSTCTNECSNACLFCYDFMLISCNVYLEAAQVLFQSWLRRSLSVGKTSDSTWSWRRISSAFPACSFPFPAQENNWTVIRPHSSCISCTHLGLRLLYHMICIAVVGYCTRSTTVLLLGKIYSAGDASLQGILYGWAELYLCIKAVVAIPGGCTHSYRIVDVYLHTTLSHVGGS